MKTHTSKFKEEIKQYGRQFDDIITVGNNVYGQDDLNSVEISYDCTLLKTCMKTLVIDSNVLLTKGDVVNYKIGLYVNGSPEYLDYGNFIVDKVEQQKDKKSYLITCYDSMIKTMVDVVHLNVTYPVTIRNYLSAICTHLGITFANASDTFTNYDEEITSEHYMSYNETKQEWEGLGYTFRDILDDIAEAVGSFIVINEDDELEIKNISNTIGKNIFNSTSVVYGYIDSSTSRVSYNTGYRVSTFKVEPNTTYTISKRKNSYNYIGTRQTSASGTLSNVTNMQDYTTSRVKATITTGANDNYLFIDLGPTNNYYTIRSSIQVEIGNEVTNFEPYGIDVIDEEYFNDKNVNIGKNYGPINVLVLSRAGVDNLVRPSTIPSNPVELKIEDNAILDQENREDFIDGIYNKINGLQFYLNDYVSKGILYYELGDKYNISIDGITYPCLMLNDDIKRTQGLRETVYTKEPKTSVTEYKYASDTDRVKENARNAYIIANKAEGKIEQVVTSIGDDGVVTAASIVTAINNAGSSVEIIADHLRLEGYTTINGGFAVDQYGTVTITDGSIIMHDDPNTDTVPKIKIIDENKNYAYNEMWSDGVFVSKEYSDSTTALKHSETADFEISGVHGSGGAIDDLASYLWFGDTYEDTNGKSVSNGLMANHFSYDDNGVKHYTEFSLIDNDDKMVMLSTGYNYFRDDVEIEGDLYNNALDKFDDTSGNDWQEMLRNKIDYCINNVNTSKTNGIYFINGGWAGIRYGFGIFSKIGDWRQLVWFCNMGIYYVSKDDSNNYGYDRVGKGIVSEIQPSNNLNDWKTDGKYTYNRGDQYYDNCPTSDGIHILNVTSNGGTDWVIQEDYVMRWGATTTEKYIRMYSPPGWSNWQRIV